MKKGLLIFGLMTLSISGFAQSGGVDGGGGKSVVCRAQDGKITSAEILDFFEGRVQYSLNPQSSNASVEEQIEAAVTRLSSGRGANFKHTLSSYVNFVQSNKVITPDGTSLLPVEDSHHVVVPKDCLVEQLANFTVQNQILINGEIWNSLDNTNKAALIVHEALYKVFRDFGATNSIRARKSVAIAFSGGTFTPILEGSPAADPKSSEPYLVCQTLNPFQGSRFYAYNDKDGELIFQFDHLEGHLMLSKATLTIDKIPVQELPYLRRDVTYWSHLASATDMFTGVAVSFKSEVTERGVTRTVLKIGLGNRPTVPTAEFYCTKN